MSFASHFELQVPFSVVSLWAAVSSFTLFYGTEHMLEYTVFALSMLFFAAYMAFITITKRCTLFKPPSEQERP